MTEHPMEMVGARIERDVSSDGWGGRMMVSPYHFQHLDGQEVPSIEWSIPLYRADTLLRALTVLDEIGDLLGAHGGEGPNGWPDEIRVLGDLLDALVEQGRAHRSPRGDIEAGRS